MGIKAHRHSYGAPFDTNIYMKTIPLFIAALVGLAHAEVIQPESPKPDVSSKSYEAAIQIGGELVNKVADKVKEMPLKEIKDTAVSSAHVAKGLLQTLIAEIPETAKPAANARSTNAEQLASPTPSAVSAQGTEAQSVKSLDELIGKDLVDKDGKKVDISKLSGKIIGIYFSAHWCPPCRQFTPNLIKFRNDHAAQFEVVFVSSDRSADDQQKYMKETGMPWPAIPFGSAQIPLLKGNFKISGIPSLVIVDEKGTLISSQGRMEVATDSANALKKWQSAKDKN